MVVIVTRVRADESGVGQLHFASSSPAAAPFVGFSEARVAVGSKCMRVVVATDPAHRSQGLRDATSLRPYDGMLFVYPRDTTARYTMANTRVPLDITFFSSSGAPVDSARMTPCPNGTDATCPVYASKKPYRFALERPAGASSASGAIGSCAA